MEFPLGHVDLLLPATARILSALAVMPIFHMRNIPAVTKIALSVVMAWLIVSPGGIPAEMPATFSDYLMGITAEVVFGLMLGFVTRLVFWAINMAGDMIGMQMGWGFAGTLHATFDMSPIVSGQLYTILVSLLYLSIGGHQMALMALSQTFYAMPPYGAVVGGLQASRLVEMTTSIFAGAVQIALPIVGTLMLIEATLAFIARVMPRMNAWIFGMPLKVGIGLISLMIALPAVLSLAARWLAQAPGNMLILAR